MGNMVGTAGQPFPTPVGMNRLLNREGMMIETVPHARGDEPLMEKGVLKSPVRSPRPWG